MEQPEFRQFNFDPVERVFADRGKYVAAALTICRAYIVAGRPGRAPRLASFDGWSDTVRSALIWLGKADPVKSMESARAEDPERVELGDMLEAWHRVIGYGHSNRAKLADVIARGMVTVRTGSIYDGQPAAFEPTHPEFYAALEGLAYRTTGKRGQKPDARLLGTWLKRLRGRIVVNGKRFAVFGRSERKEERRMVG
jgi:hypothetical protein